MIVLIIVLVAVLLFFAKQSDFAHLKPVQSTIDRETYFVLKDRANEVAAADTLARAKQVLYHVTTELQKRLSANSVPADLVDNVKLLLERVRHNGIRLFELAPDNRTIAYNADKGDMIFVCLRESTQSPNIGKFDTVMYVLLHEMAHAMVAGFENHSATFQRCENYLYDVAQQIKLFDPNDIPLRKHCGAIIPLHQPSLAPLRSNN